jgi:DNA-binding LytR/AlgR family response regulator
VFPHGGLTSGAPALSSDLLAIVVAVVAFIVSGVFLLLLVPDRKPATAQAAAGSAALSMPAPIVEAAHAEPVPVDVRITDDELGTLSPLGGTGAPRGRIARRLPVERDGMTHYVTVEDIVAVHANAHYTYIFTGSAKLFCPLAIGDVEARLDGSRFARVHRSHIVNLDRVVGMRRSGDGGLVELAAPDRYSVPVARSRVGWFKARIGSKLDQVAS